MANEVPTEVVAALRARFSAGRSYFKMLIDRVAAGVWLPVAGEYLGLASVCLHDLADLVQRSERGLYDAHLSWITNEKHVDDPQLAASVHFTRYHFDYAAVSMSAASNHLASSMWHLEEKIATPLGKKYKSAAAVRDEWAKRVTPPRSYDVLRDLLGDSDWTLVSEYRHEWIHRGLPVIKGEYRQERRALWQAADQPPPGPYFMKKTTGDGKLVAYMVQYDDTARTMPALLDHGEKALAALVKATRAYVQIHDDAYGPFGVTFDGDDKAVFRPAQSDKPLGS
jgi:hypothetical protein